MHTLKPAKGSKFHSKRVGRGNASGKGTYSARGAKGQKARSGGRSGLKKIALRRILLVTPKNRGFRSSYPRAKIVKLNDLEKLVKDGETITRRLLIKLNLISSNESKIKLLGEGRITKKFVIKDILVSKKAREIIEAAGGKIE